MVRVRKQEKREVIEKYPIACAPTKTGFLNIPATSVIAYYVLVFTFCSIIILFFFVKKFMYIHQKPRPPNILLVQLECL